MIIKAVNFKDSEIVRFYQDDKPIGFMFGKIVSISKLATGDKMVTVANGHFSGCLIVAFVEEK